MSIINVSTKKHPNTFCEVDEEDVEWINKFKWSAHERPNGFYVTRGCVSTGGERTNVRLHREILRARSHEQVDHKDGNGLNCKKNNLRICDNVENQQNRFLHKSKANGVRYKGVGKRINKSTDDTYYAYITIDKKRVNLGTFTSEEEAAKAYDVNALYYFKGFARLNFGKNNTACLKYRVE